MKDICEEFFDLYQDGETLRALRLVLKHPNISYDDLKSHEPTFEKAINFADATVFQDLQSSLHSSYSLIAAIQQNPAYSDKYKALIDQLTNEARLLATLCDQKPEYISFFNEAVIKFFNTEIYHFLLEQKDIDQIIEQTPPAFKKLISEQFRISQAWISFIKKHPKLHEYFSNYFKQMCRPYKFFSFASTPELPKIDPKQIPLIFLFPFEKDYTPLLEEIKNKPAIFIFETYFNLIQMLQFPGMSDSFEDPSHLIYVMEHPSNRQFALQNIEAFKEKNLQPITFYPNQFITEGLPALIEALKANFLQSKEDLQKNTEPESWLYKVAKNIIYRIQQKRFGLKRSAAFTETWATNQWFDSHKIAPLPSRNLGPQPEDYLKVRLEQLVPKSKKIKLAHVVTQICDGGHAPSTLIENLIHHRNKEKFDVTLVITERLRFRPNDYPYNYHTTSSSRERAPARLNRLNQEGIKFVESSPLFNYELAALSVAETLKSFQPDVVVFHGPDVINTVAANYLKGPLRVLFEHGSPAHQAVYDLAIASSESAVSTFKELYERLKIELKVLPFQVDKRINWLPEPFTKEQLGFSADNILITTVSNHLDTRLSDEMILAISEILKRIPNSIYAPIGKINDKKLIEEKFALYNVQDRFRPLGSMHVPSQYCRTMDLYLNEFPFGGCISLLDAIASGCPIVSMFDKDGPQQSRYAGDYLGLDRVITSGKREEYVELACKLLTDKTMYQEWKEHTLKQYEKHNNLNDYVQGFETILEEALKKRGLIR